MSRIAEEFGRAAVPDSYGIAAMSHPYEEVSSEAVRSLIRDAIEETADRGDVVIVSHGASFALSRRPNVLRVLLTASPETRMGRLLESQGLDPNAARKAIKDADAARSDYLRRFYGVETELPTHYDLVVNTDILSVEQAAVVIAQGASGATCSSGRTAVSIHASRLPGCAAASRDVLEPAGGLARIVRR